MTNRKGQAAIVAIALVIFLIVYLFILRTDERCKILPELPECNETNGGNESIEKTLINTTEIGLLKEKQENTEYRIMSVDLFNREEVEFPFMLSLDPVIKKSWFSSEKMDQDFSLNDKVLSVKLFINVAEARGKVGVVINGKTVATFKGAGQHIISLPLAYLSDENTMSLRVSTPLFFWSTNYYRLNSVIIKETYKLTKTTDDRQIFIKEDLSELKKATFSFRADCLSQENLQVWLNNDILISDKLCTKFERDVTESLVQNTSVQWLKFSTTGNYFIHDILLELEFNYPEYKTYYFTLDDEQYDTVGEGEMLAMLTLKFPDIDRKELNIYINGITVYVDTSKSTYETAVNSYLQQGQNSVKIVPETDVEISEFKLELK